MCFYDWLREKTDYITDYDNLIKICNIFELNDYNISHLKKFETIKIMNGLIIPDTIKNIIKAEGFIFPL